MGATARAKEGVSKQPLTAKVTAKPGLALIPQPDGRGALLSGGMPGNRGGIGKPKSLVRQRCRDSFDERIPVLEKIVDGVPIEHVQIPLAAVVGLLTCPKGCGPMVPIDPGMALTQTVDATKSARASDRIRAMEQLGKFGVGERTEQVHTLVSPDIRGRLARMGEVIRSRPNWPTAELVEALRPIWSDDSEGDG